MAETLLGRHYEATCPSCGYSYVFDAAVPTRWRPVCPNCGQRAAEPHEGLQLGSDRVLIDRSAFLFRNPRRWEVIACRRPSKGGQWAVKRVVGLPGERVQIRHGDVYVNDQVQRKTLRQQRAMPVLVYDANFPPAGEPSPLPGWYERGENNFVGVAPRRLHAPGHAQPPRDRLARLSPRAPRPSSGRRRV